MFLALLLKHMAYLQQLFALEANIKENRLAMQHAGRLIIDGLSFYYSVTTT